LAGLFSIWQYSKDRLYPYLDSPKERFMEEVVQQIKDCILNFNQDSISDRVREALEAGIEPERVLNAGMIAAMAEVGRLFEEGEFFVPEMLVAARTMQTGLAALKPHLVEANVKPAGRIALGTVRGDLHDIGKNLVGIMLEGAGFEVIDLGVDVPPERFLELVQGGDVKIIGLSALLTTTMPNMKSTVDALKEAGLRDKVKVILGGAPLTDAYAREIEADGYAADASRAVKLVKRLIE
jgi:5-methyltetrahydrofolate--homocysteine methyltransferase